MTSSRDAIQQVTAVAPELGQAWGELCSGEDLESSWVHLAFGLMDRAKDGRLPDLPLIAPLIEDFLDRYDAKDFVSLLLIEAILLQVHIRGLDVASIRDSWGPKARGVWDSLS